MPGVVGRKKTVDYPIDTLPQARYSLVLLERDHRENYISTARYLDVRPRILHAIARFKDGDDYASPRRHRGG
jgi:hypothetical protein